MDGEAGWWTTSGNIGLPPLARVMGMGRQQQHGSDGVGDGEDVVAVSAGYEYVSGTGIVSSAAGVLGLSVVRGMRGVSGVCEMYIKYMYLARAVLG